MELIIIKCNSFPVFVILSQTDYGTGYASVKRMVTYNIRQRTDNNAVI